MHYLISPKPDRLKTNSLQRSPILENYKISSELVHFCTQCKSDQNHRVVEMNKEAPKRVMCLTCQSSRVFRPKPMAVRRAAFGKAAAAKEAQENQWRQKLQENKRAPKVYKMDGSYKVDDVVSHNTFGLGLTTQLISPDKMQIFFDDGLKLLKCGPTNP